MSIYCGRWTTGLYDGHSFLSTRWHLESPWKHTCGWTCALVEMTVAATKHHNQKQLGEESVCLI